MPATELKVELIAYTPDPQQLVALAGKTCYSGADLDELKKGVEQRDQTAFVKRLMGMGHLSTIEHASFTFAVQGVSRSLLAQITRHRIASFSVQSQRYVRMGSEGEFYYVIPERIRALGEEAVAKFSAQMEKMQSWYDGWLEALGQSGESAQEDARFVLPNAAETRFLVTMNARELLHFFELRCCNRAQWEVRHLAWRMLRLCLPVAPDVFAQAGPGCVRGRCPEGKKSCGRAAEVQQKRKALLEEERI